MRGVTLQRRQTFIAVALFAVCGLLAGTAVAAVRWRADNAVWRARALAAETKQAKAEVGLASARRELTALSKESAELRERVDEIANEKAGVEDDVAMAKVERDSYERLATRFADTIELWRECVKGHEQWAQVLANKSRYNTADVKRYYSDLEAVCTDAEQADDALRSQLSQ